MYAYLCHVCVYVHIYVCMYVSESQSYRRESKKARSSMCCVASQVATTAMIELSEDQEPEALAVSPTWVARAQTLELSFSAFPGH